jgi:hypothetical protein
MFARKVHISSSALPHPTFPPTSNYAIADIAASLIGAWNPSSRDVMFVSCRDGVSLNIQYMPSELMFVKDLTSVNSPWAVNLKYIY